MDECDVRKLKNFEFRFIS